MFLSFFSVFVCRLIFCFANQITQIEDVHASEPSSSDSVHNLIDLKKDEHCRPPVVEAVNEECKSSLPFHKSLNLPSTSSYPMLVKSPSKIHISSSLQSFQARTVKHHSFDSDLDVKYMEKNLISLLDDFHNGKKKRLLFAILFADLCLKFKEN